MNRRFASYVIVLFLASMLIPGCDEAPLDGTGDGGNSKFTVYFTDNGLADNWITDIAVDHIRGGVWLATKNGLSFYSNMDSSFTTYGAESDIPDMEMTSVIVDINESTWVCTVTGAAYMTKLDSLFHYLPGMDNLVHRYVTDMIYTSAYNGMRWFGTRGGISVQTMSDWISYTTQLGPSYDITSLVIGPGNDIWAGSTNGIAVWNGADWNLQFAPNLPSNYVNTIYNDGQGRMWVGTASIATMWDGENWTNYGPADGLPSTGITAFIRDTDGVLWAGTNSGVYFQGLYTWNQFELPSNAGSTVTALAWDSATRSLWIGTKTGAVQYVAGVQ